MIYYDKKKNMLMESEYEYNLQERAEPNLYREMFPYDEAPKLTFNNRVSPVDPPDDIWITDTTFRDGQQSRAPYTTDQIVQLYKYLNKLGGPNGIIRQTEFFLYSDRDKAAVSRCQELGFKFPEVTGWIRAHKKDFELAKDMGLKECGILVSCSDYHIYKKLKKTRRQAMDDYLGIIKSALEIGIRPRCHFEDITRADFYGFVVPFVHEISKLSRESGISVKIRACDTLGYGVPYPGVSLPRSIPGIIYGLRNYAGLEPEQLEWHGHNDFYKAVVNSTSAWLYGASGVNCSLLGIGERTGNTPLEAMVFEYAQLKGSLDGMDTTVIRDIADYYEGELEYKIPSRTPFVGRDFNMTQAGIHADGILKDEEIYNIFDTGKLLKSPPGVAITATSGAAGIAMWLMSHAFASEKIEKDDPRVTKLKEWVDEQYTDGRVTTISYQEMWQAVHMLNIV
ncbi:MAG: 2-isopropylmalate synthase [Oscillospiraceae bacterium]|jgi:isopropylmalate/homocitrate/citramalate synthase|nr:2-isopropylmalate synthase [Oscillospiraceae bacterium]